MRAAFEYHDQNGSGYLDYTELRNALAYMGYDVDTETTCELLRAYDDYPDGKLEIAEFSQLVNDLNRAEEEAAEAADEEEAWAEDDDGSPEAEAARRVARRVAPDAEERRRRQEAVAEKLAWERYRQLPARRPTARLSRGSAAAADPSSSSERGRTG